MRYNDIVHDSFLIAVLSLRLMVREGEGGSGQEDIWEGRGGKEGGGQGGEVGGGGHVEHFILFI